MFIFIIPRVPLKMRNALRNDLWEISKKSLLSQTSSNWKAIVIGDTEGEDLDEKHFIKLNFDLYSKQQKIGFALDYLQKNKNINAKYLIRFDDDDVFSSTILDHIGGSPEKYDCYFDNYHTYIDPVYLKISYVKNRWIPNTAIHKYDHAIKICGSESIPLITQDHSDYWHIYYKDKKVNKFGITNTLYYRILTPYSITSSQHQVQGVVDWSKYLNYLKGYGPWISLPKEVFYSDLQKLSNMYFPDKPKLSKLHWAFNRLKFFKKYLLSS